MEKKRYSVAYLLWFLFGPLGAYRFYLGQTRCGVFYVLTFGIFVIGWVIDFFMIPAYVKAYNHRVDSWRGAEAEEPVFAGGAGV